jgi:hypothetical protein
LNDDLQDGAKLWLAGIAADAKQDVFYYTTTYKQNTLFGDYCNLAVNLVLQWPNDGTAEYNYAQLEGATNMGNKEVNSFSFTSFLSFSFRFFSLSFLQKWCHTTDMSYPAQYTDHERNKEMNEAAAR